jgi:hypothetical protein
MSDGTSCESFSLVYSLLADANLPRKDIAEKLWKHQRQLDFWMSDMDVDVALSKLGLATACKCGDFIYKDYEDHHECREE